MIRPDPGGPSEQLSWLIEPGDEAFAGHRFASVHIAIPLWFRRLLWLAAGTVQWRSTCCGKSPRSGPVAIARCCRLRRLPRWVKLRVRSCILPSFLPGIGESVPGSSRKNKHLKIWHGACLVQGTHRQSSDQLSWQTPPPLLQPTSRKSPTGRTATKPRRKRERMSALAPLRIPTFRLTSNVRQIHNHGARSRWQKRRGGLAPCDYEVIPRQPGVSSSTEDKAS